MVVNNMNADLFAEALEYELLTQAIYQAILRRDGHNIDVQHDVKLPGKSGVHHQIDVIWKFRMAGIDHAVAIECKNYATAITLEKVRNFYAVLHDVGNCQGIMVTRTGYQTGAEQFAQFYGIGLKVLRKPMPRDWDGRIKDIQINLHTKSVVSTPDRPIQVHINFLPRDAQEEGRLQALIATNRLLTATPPELVFWNKDRTVTTEPLRWWLAKQLKVVDKIDGGPYKQIIHLPDHYVVVNQGQLDEEFIQVRQLDVEYFVQTVENRSIILRGEELVEAILKDFASGGVEYVKHRNN